MKNFLELTTSFFLFLFLAITLLVFLHEPPTGSNEDAYIEYASFWSDWGKVILIIWAGSLVTTIIGMLLKSRK